MNVTPEQTLMQTFIDQEPVSEREKQRLAELEKVIAESICKAFVVAGRALKEIRDYRLYRETHATFEAYCKDLWDMMRAHAYRLIEAAEVYENVSHGRQIEILPANERQARALVKLSPEDQVKVWQKAVETAPNGKITANHIKKTIRDMNADSITKVVRKAKKESVPKEKMSLEFKEAFDVFFERVRIERLQNWKNTDKAVVLRFLEALHTAVRSEI